MIPRHAPTDALACCNRRRWSLHKKWFTTRGQETKHHSKNNFDTADWYEYGFDIYLRERSTSYDAVRLLSGED